MCVGFVDGDDDWCVSHGRDHMRKRSTADKFAYCEACESDEREGMCDCCNETGRLFPIEGTRVCGKCAEEITNPGDYLTAE